MLAYEKADNIYHNGSKGIKITISITQELYVCQTKQILIIQPPHILTSTLCSGLFT